MTVNRFAGQVFTPAEVRTDTPRFDDLGNLSMENRAEEAKKNYLGQAQIATGGFKGVERIAQAQVNAEKIKADAEVAAAQSQGRAVSSLGSSLAKGISGLNIGGSATAATGAGYMNPAVSGIVGGAMYGSV